MIAFDVTINLALKAAVDWDGDVSGELAEPFQIIADRSRQENPARDEPGPLNEIALSVERAQGSRELHLVQSLRKSLHEISDEIARWRNILAVSYQEYLLPR
jgi:hypothetical protein